MGNIGLNKNENKAELGLRFLWMFYSNFAKKVSAKSEMRMFLWFFNNGRFWRNLIHVLKCVSLYYFLQIKVESVISFPTMFGDNLDFIRFFYPMYNLCSFLSIFYLAFCLAYMQIINVVYIVIISYYFYSVSYSNISQYKTLCLTLPKLHCSLLRNL